MAKPGAHKQILGKGLIAAASASMLLKVRQALDFGADPSYQDAEQAGWCALHFCCYFSEMERPAERICKMLLEHGANPDSQARDGLTPLLAASAVGSIEAVKLLLEANAAVNLQDGAGRTPLMAAAERGCCPVVKLLLAAGARVDLLDRDGRDAMAIARAPSGSGGAREGGLAAAAMLEAALLQAELYPASRRMKS